MTAIEKDNEPDPAAEWPRLLRPIARRGWWPHRYRPYDVGRYLIFLLVVVLSPIALAVVLLAAPIVLVFFGVRGLFRWFGAWGDEHG